MAVSVEHRKRVIAIRNWRPPVESDLSPAQYQLAVDHYRLVWYVIRRWFPWALRWGMPAVQSGRYDAIDYGWMALLRAAKGWRGEGESTFACYATACLRLAFRRFSEDCQRWARMEGEAEGHRRQRHSEEPPASLAIDLADAVAALPAPERELFEAWADAEYSATALAKRTGAKPRTVMQRLEKVKARLRKRLSAYSEGEPT